MRPNVGEDGSRRQGPLRFMVLLAAAGVAASCGAAPLPNSAPSPVPGVEMASWLNSLPARGGEELWLRNDSDAYYHIVSVTIRDCRNIDGPCGEVPLDLTLCPGDARRLRTVSPTDRNLAWHFNWDFQAERYPSLDARIGLSCTE